jgi:hypothetical protein
VSGSPLTPPSPPRDRGLEPISPLPVGEGWVRALFPYPRHCERSEAT